jgi:hypothetical protein
MMIALAFGVATIAVVSLTTGSTNSRLPLPEPVDLTTAAHGGTAFPGTSSGGSKVGTVGGRSAGSNQQQTFTATPLTPLTGCSVSVSNPHPIQGQTAETATIVTTAGAQVRLEADYARTRSVHSGLADSSGAIAFPLPIDHAQLGVTVRVVATATLRGVQRSCQTSFTPVA